MYIVISRSGSMASSVSSWAITSLAEASSIWTPRKMIRSSKSLLYGFISLIPYEVRSTKDGSTYLDCGCITFGSWLLGLLAWRWRGAGAAGGLVHQDCRVRECVALAGGAGGEQELSHRRGHAHREGGDVVGHELHHVVDREAGVHRAARRVDVQVDVAVGVLGGQQQDLGADPVGDLIIHLLPKED